MKTNRELIIQTLHYLKVGNISLEDAIDLAKKKTQLPLLDSIDILRYLLVSLKLIKHNPRAGNYVENRQGIVTFSPSFIIQDDFKFDHLTEDCIEMIEGGIISNIELEMVVRKKIFLYVGHSDWGKSFVLRYITDNNSRKKVKILYDRIFRIRKMSNDDDEQKLLDFVKGIKHSTYNNYLIAFCPRQNESERTKEILTILANTGDLYFLIQKNQYGSTNIITENEIDSLKHLGVVNILIEDMEYPNRAEAFLRFIKKCLQID